MKKLQLVIIFTLLAFLSGAAHAQVKDKVFKGWTVYSTDLKGKKTCYIAAFPNSKTGNYKKRNEPYFLVTKVANGVFEVSASSGFEYKANGDVKVDIQGDKFTMFTKGDMAWAPDGKQDSRMIEMIKKKSTMDVRGESLKGTYAVDRYSLAGFSDAYSRMDKLCE
jgi:hypothetical protein